MRTTMRVAAAAVLLFVCAGSAYGQGSQDVERLYLWSGGASRMNISAGSGAPSGGVNADLYVDYTTSTWYRRVGGAWEVLPMVSLTNTWTAVQTFTPGITLGASGNLFGGTNLVQQRNGVSPQELDVCNTWTSATNFECGIFMWNSDILRIGTAKGSGGGSARNIQLQIAGSSVLSLTAANATFGFALSAPSLTLTSTPLPCTSGGTGNGSWTVGGVVYAAGGCSLAGLTPVAVGQVLTSTGLLSSPAWSGNPTLSSIASTSYAAHTAGWIIDSGGNLETQTVSAKELHVGALVAQSTIATIGGRILVAPTTYLTANLAAAGTTITVKHNNLVSGDRIYLESVGQSEWMAVTSSAGGSAGAYTYTVTRNLDGGGANDWIASDAIVDTGTTGNGFLDLYSSGGVFSGTGPTVVCNVRTGTTYNNVSPRCAFGNLNGLYGYSGSTYGAAFGDPSGAWVKIDPTNGVRLGHNATTKVQIDASGNASFASGNTTIDTNGIRLTPAGASTFAYTSAYGFNMTTANTGTWVYQTGSNNSLVLTNQWTGAGSVAQSNIVFEWGNGTYNGSMAMYAANALSKSQIEISVGEFKINASPITFFNSNVTQSNAAGTLINTFQPGFIGTSTGDLVVLAGNSQTVKCFSGGGCTIGVPTGGDKGAGTLNAVAVYDDGVLLTDWVFDDAYGGAVGALPRSGSKRLFSLAETRAMTEQEHRLPWMPAASDFEQARGVGGMLTRIWQGQEQQQLYIFDLESRIAALERRQQQ